MGSRTVLQQLYSVALQVPANTPASAPLVFSWNLGDSTLEHFDVTFTAGAAFLCGVHVKLSQVVIVPWGQANNASSTSWIIGSGEAIATPVSVDVDGGVVVEAYNLDPINFHTLFLRAYVISNAAANAGGASSDTQVVAVTSASSGGGSADQTSSADNAALVDQLAAGVG